MFDESMNKSQEPNDGEESGLPVASAKAKRERKPRKQATAITSKPLYALLRADKTYEELNETELQDAAANVVKDTTLRLVKIQIVEVQISFKVV